MCICRWDAVGQQTRLQVHRSISISGPPRGRIVSRRGSPGEAASAGRLPPVRGRDQLRRDDRARQASRPAMSHSAPRPTPALRHRTTGLATVAVALCARTNSGVTTPADRPRGRRCRTLRRDRSETVGAVWVEICLLSLTRLIAYTTALLLPHKL